MRLLGMGFLFEGKSRIIAKKFPGCTFDERAGTQNQRCSSKIVVVVEKQLLGRS
jgi:hypothetical protein